MSDVHYVPPSFTKIVDQFDGAKGKKHVRYDNERHLHIHDGKKWSGFGKDAKQLRLQKQQAGAKLIKDVITRDYGPRVAEHLFPTGKKTINLDELRSMKAQLHNDPRTQQLAMFELVRNEIVAKKDKELETFLRENTEGSKAVSANLNVASGGHFAKISGMMAQLVDNGEPSAMTKADLEKLKETDREKALSQSIANLKRALHMLFGGTDLQDIRKAARLVPQAYCDQLATAVLAIDSDKKLGEDVKQKVKQMVFSNFGALRLVNPVLLDLSKRIEDPVGQTAVKDLSKQIQNIGNGMRFGVKEKVGGENEFNALLDQWTPVYHKFMEELAARGKPIVTA
jgi:hypothetical protein